MAASPRNVAIPKAIPPVPPNMLAAPAASSPGSKQVRQAAPSIPASAPWRRLLDGGGLETGAIVDCRIVGGADVSRTLGQRIHNPRNRACACAPDCWCQRTALGRGVKWWFPGRYFGLHHNNQQLAKWKRSQDQQQS